MFFLEADALAAGDRLVLDGAEGRHAADVRRLRLGEQLVVTDGAGRAARAEVAEVSRGALVIAVLDRWTEPEPAPRLVVVQALAKGDRGETAVGTLTEVGVDVIVPWSAARSVTRWSDERAPKALERWRSAARESAKQSRRVRWPEVRALASTPEVAALLGAASVGLVLHEEAAGRVGDVSLPAAGDVVVVVGPEGGITPEELADLTSVAEPSRPAPKAVRLGPSVLRTSTAGTAAASVLLARSSRWA